jgi:Concanavalin A-like lectin/glucanases superfamily
MTVKHTFTSAIADGVDATLVRPSNWNAAHSAITQVELSLGSVPVRSGRFRISQYALTVLADGPSSYWPLDEPAGTFAVDHMNAANGTYTGSPTQGIPGADLLSTGGFSNTAYVDLGNVYSMDTGDWSIDFWFYPLAVPGSTQRLMQKATAVGWAVQYDSSRNMTFLVDGGGVTGSHVAPINQWNHFAMTRAGADFRYIYLNSVNDGSTSAVNPTITTATLAVGGGAAGTAFGGRIYGFAVYPFALTPAQVTAHYNAGVSARAGTPVTTTKALVEQAANAYTGKGTRPDESAMDAINCRPVVMSDGSVDIYWSSPTFVWKNFKFNYMSAG